MVNIGFRNKKPGDKPLTEENFVDTDIVICDSCGERIL
jgi:hypothetical protein